MGVWALMVILLGMSASFSGWWLATSILQSEWWKNFASFFGLGYYCLSRRDSSGIEVHRDPAGDQTVRSSESLLTPERSKHPRR